MKNAQLRYLQPEYRLASDPKELEALLGSELSDWLALSWFYPEGFELQRVRETPECFVATGVTLEYIFPKLKKNSHKNKQSAQQARWEYVVREIENSQLLARERFLGVRLLQWQDGELHWLPGMLAHPLSAAMPADADEIALVARRVPDGTLLSDVLADDGELSLPHFEHLLEKVVNFHRQATSASQGVYAISHVEQGVFEPLRIFQKEYAQGLDPFSRAALREIETFLEQQFACSELLFRRRAKEGYVISSHGALRAHQVALGALPTDDNSVAILGRNGRQQDVLADLASLVVDLELYEADYIATELCERYQELLPEHFDETLMRFYLVSEGLRAAIEAFGEAGADRTVRANRALGYALRRALGMPERALLLLCGSASDEAQGLAETFAELFALPYLGAEDIRNGLGSADFPEQLLLDRFCTWCDRIIVERGMLVAQWTGVSAALSSTSYQRIKLWLEQQTIPHRLIRCEQFETIEETKYDASHLRHSHIDLALQIVKGMR